MSNCQELCICIFVLFCCILHLEIKPKYQRPSLNALIQRAAVCSVFTVGLQISCTAFLFPKRWVKKAAFLSCTLKISWIRAALATPQHTSTLQTWTSHNPAPELGRSLGIFTHPPAQDWTAAAVPWPYSPRGPSHTPLPHTTLPAYWPLKHTHTHTKINIMWFTWWRDKCRDVYPSHHSL